jgi:hypothetical protein
MDLDAIQEGGLWNANFDTAACYLQERAQVRFSLRGVETNGESQLFRIGIDDGLPDSIYDEPLTIKVCSGGAALEIGGVATATRTAEGNCERFEAIPNGSVFDVTLTYK